MSSSLQSLCRLLYGLCLVVSFLQLSPSNAQLTTCQYQGYDLSGLTGNDLFYSNGTVEWAIHPCGIVVSPDFCTDGIAYPSQGEFCEGGTTISVFNTTDEILLFGDRGPVWAQVEVDGQYGVAQFSQTGAFCGDINADRQGTIIYVCNATASTPFISNVTQVAPCFYQAVIQSALLCPQVPPHGLSTAVGTNIISSECGGSIYDLSSLTGSDLISSPMYDPLGSANYTYVVRVCGATSSQCSAGASVCQVDSSATGAAAGLNYTLAVWEPQISPAIWQYLGDGVISLLLQDGATGQLYFEQVTRLTNITFVCNPTAETPTIVSAVEGPPTTYVITVQTNAVCGAAFLVPPAATTSSSSASPSPSASSSSTAPARVIGDPQFMGLRGQSYQVHGIDGAVYNLIIDGTTLVNARFRYLSSGRCSAMAGASNCWSHPGSYLGEVGVVAADGGRLHVVSGGWESGFEMVVLDGMVMAVGSNTTQAGMSVHLLSAYQLRVQVGNFELLLENSDRFVNIVEMRVLDWSKLSSHGLLGQTWRTPRKAGKQVRHIEGDVDDYVEQNGDLFGSKLVYGVGGTEAADRE